MYGMEVVRMDYNKLYINGEWVDGASGKWIEVENPYTMEKFARVPRGNAEDVDKAAKAAKAAFPAWSSKTLDERIALMENFLSAFRSYEDELVDMISKELGAPKAFARTSHCEYQYTRVRSYIDLAPSVPMIEKMEQSTTYRFPVGVIGCITPWNYPLGQVIQKVVPALLMGNTVVLKPSQQTPLTSYILADCFEKAGFPAGVFNFVTGRGGEVGNALSTHPDVDMVSFTGSTKGGVEVSRQALGTVKHISLELGGKSPCVLLPSDDYEQAIRACFNTIFLNSGQTCTALSRILVPSKDKEAIEQLMKDIVKEYVAGDPSDPSVKLGSVASRAQFDKIKSYIERGLAEGARLLAGSVPSEPEQGYFIDPVIFTDVDNGMDIAQEEIFGPVLCVIGYDDIDEAVRIANDVKYGLNAAVWGPKDDAINVALRIESGNVYINDGPRDTAAPFGGWKQSGIGREGGVYGMIEFTQQKALFDTGH